MVEVEEAVEVLEEVVEVVDGSLVLLEVGKPTLKVLRQM